VNFLPLIRPALEDAVKDIDPLLVFGNLQIDLMSRKVKKKNALVKLISAENNLLALLIRNKGKALTHHYLLRTSWSAGYINRPQYLKVFSAQNQEKV
jgi:two-component system, OmpR family, KDP operon response regulator KdpE